MMKKILSMLMAVAMIVSMLPLSVFAAEEPLCPGQSHLHNLTNCDWTQGETVAPECGKHGYTLYECNACHVSFAGNFVEPEQHKWIVDTEAKAPSCTEDGALVAEKCELCGEPKPGTGAVDPATGHVQGNNPVYGDCKNGLFYDCTVCGEKVQIPVTDNAHTWCEIPVIIDEPTSPCDLGHAEYTCTVCGEKKVVDIQNEECRLDAKTGTGATCTEPGVKDHFQCRVCGGLYLNGERVTEEDLVIPATGHVEDRDTWIVLGKLTDWSCTTDETYEIQCPNCDYTETKVTKEADHDYFDTPLMTVDATCTTYGFTTYACKACGHVEKTDSVAPLGHTAFDCGHTTADPECRTCANPSTNQVAGVPTCTQSSKNTWNCGVCGADCEEPVAATGCDIKEVVVDATCSMYGYTFTYCANACDNAENLLDPAAQSAWTVDGVDYDVTVEGQPVYLISIVVDAEAGYDPNNHTEDPARSFWVDGVAADCETSAYKMVYCLDCEYAAIEYKEAWGHNFEIHIYDGCGRHTNEHSGVLKNGDTYHVTYDENYVPSAYANRTVDVRCTNPNCVITPVVGERSNEKMVGGCYDGKKIDAVFGNELMRSVHNTNGITLDPATGEPFTTGTPCTGITGYQYCDECGRGNAFRANGTPNSNAKAYTVAKAVSYDPFNIYNSFEDLLAVHPNVDINNPTVAEPGDCYNMGVYIFRCPDCNKNHPVAIPSTGSHVAPTAQDWADLLATAYPSYTGTFEMGVTAFVWVDNAGNVWKSPVDATCVTNGNTAAYVCSSCGEYVASETIECAGEHVEVIDKEAADATCTEDGWTQGSHCGVCGEVLSVSTPITASGHGNWILLDHVLDATCTQFKYNHWACGNPGCDYEFINYYRPALGHEEVTVKVPSTCTTPGLKGCANCTDLDVVIEAGHRNEAGDLIVDACTDTVEDRLCVMCDQTIAKSHTDLQHDEHPATCTQNAYHIDYCNDCGYTSVTEIENTMAHSPVIDWEASYAPTHSSKGLYVYVCEFCGKDMGSDEIDMLPGIGFGIELDNALVSGANNIVDEDGNVIGFRPVDGDIIAVDIYMDGYEAKVWGFNFDLSYYAAGMNFLGYKFQAADLFGKYMVNNLTEDYAEYDYNDYDNDGVQNEYVSLVEDIFGTVKVSAYTELELNGEKVDATITGPVKVVTLYFQIEAYYEGINYFVPEFDYMYSNYLSIDEAFMSNSEGAEEYCDGDYTWFDVAQMLDTNDNGIFNIKDLENCYKIIKGLADYEYLAAADANKDGIVDLTDLDIMNQYLVGRVDDLGIYAAMNWTAPEGFVAAE